MVVGAPPRDEGRLFSLNTMTPKERWLAVLKGEKPDRIPMDYWATPEVTSKLLDHMECKDLAEVFDILHIDLVARAGGRFFGPDRLVTAGGRYIGPKVSQDEDIFGCRYKDIKYATGTYRWITHNPLAIFNTIKEIKDNYTWPEPDWWSYSEIGRDMKGNADLPVWTGGCHPFDTYRRIRGEKQAYVDLIRNPDLVRYCLDKLVDLAYEITLKTYEQMPTDALMITHVSEDLGTQTSLTISPRLIRQFIIPTLKRMFDLAHEHGAYVFHHNDGAIRQMLPDLLASGIDLLNPIQWRCRGMDRQDLKHDFGDRLVFHGAMDNQRTLPFGSVKDVVEEVKTNLRILGKNGRYILAPCHNIQANTPPENIVAMYETGYREGSQYL